jgi:hypothetical protein
MTSAQQVVEWQNAVAMAFDYSALAPDVADEMRERAGCIHGIRQASVLEVGQELIAAKRGDEHGCFPARGRMTPNTSQPDLDRENDERQGV